jgi:hypothetical protein
MQEKLTLEKIRDILDGKAVLSTECLIMAEAINSEPLKTIFKDDFKHQKYLKTQVEDISFEAVYFSHGHCIPDDTKRYKARDVFTVYFKNTKEISFSAQTKHKSEKVIKGLLKQLQASHGFTPNVDWDSRFNNVWAFCIHDVAKELLVKENIGEIKQNVMALDSNICDVFIGWHDICILLNESLLRREETGKDRVKVLYSTDINEFSNQILSTAIETIIKNDKFGLWRESDLRIVFGNKKDLERKNNDKYRFIYEDCDYGGDYLYGSATMTRKQMDELKIMQAKNRLKHG